MPGWSTTVSGPGAGPGAGARCAVAVPGNDCSPTATSPGDTPSGTVIPESRAVSASMPVAAAWLAWRSFSRAALIPACAPVIPCCSNPSSAGIIGCGWFWRVVIASTAVSSAARAVA
ncbi:hypothetical protein LQ327_24855 [Actinomycetospora endophytica]|uniref:Uncharacterized protein n=1 Tax=Actinomycetospora endophytica TaxID=2291215 RepID=A0ABS8PEB0_9PSEU|nr:hypothetical protein [Actinomycetospora endophytica]